MMSRNYDRLLLDGCVGPMVAERRMPSILLRSYSARPGSIWHIPLAAQGPPSADGFAVIACVPNALSGYPRTAEARRFGGSR
jgi:hypothetical protein